MFIHNNMRIYSTHELQYRNFSKLHSFSNNIIFLFQVLHVSVENDFERNFHHDKQCQIDVVICSNHDDAYCVTINYYYYTEQTAATE